MKRSASALISAILMLLAGYTVAKPPRAGFNTPIAASVNTVTKSVNTNDNRVDAPGASAGFVQPVSTKGASRSPVEDVVPALALGREATALQIGELPPPPPLVDQAIAGSPLSRTPRKLSNAPVDRTPESITANFGVPAPKVDPFARQVSQGAVPQQPTAPYTVLTQIPKPVVSCPWTRQSGSRYVIHESCVA